MEAGGEMGVSNTGKKRREERERKKRRLFRAAQFLRPWKRMEDIENRFELTAIQKSGFEGIQSFFWGGGGEKEKEKKEEKGGRDEKILLQIGNFYPDLYPAASSTPVG